MHALHIGLVAIFVICYVSGLTTDAVAPVSIQPAWQHWVIAAKLVQHLLARLHRLFVTEYKAHGY
jgi:hypothetical protein